MMKFRKAIVTAAALIAGHCATANAADLLPPPVVEPVPIPEPVAVHDIYLKAFIGASNQEADDLSNTVIDAGDFTIYNKEFDSAPFIGLGVGWQYSDRFRFDGTGEYRSRATFHGLDRNNTALTSNDYSGYKSEWLFLANAYWDIGTFRGITPYVGGGIGAAEVTLSNFTDTNEATGGHHWAKENSEWNFAWALHAGFSYEISNDLTFDFGYRYTHLGDGVTGTFQTYDNSPIQGPLTLEDIDSHDVMVGLRWNFGGSDCCASPEAVPIAYNPPAPAYIPPTTYK